MFGSVHSMYKKTGIVIINPCILFVFGESNDLFPHNYSQRFINQFTDFSRLQ